MLLHFLDWEVLFSSCYLPRLDLVSITVGPGSAEKDAEKDADGQSGFHLSYPLPIWHPLRAKGPAN